MSEERSHWIKIKTDDLRVGMFIADMGRAWMKHPFLTNKKLLTSLKQIEKLKEYGIAEVYIDPRRGWKLSREEDLNNRGKEIGNSLFPGLQKEIFSLPPLDSARFEGKIPMHQELQEAKKIHQEAKIIVRQVMQDVRMGKNIESKKVKRVVQRMTESILRNPDALVSLTRLKGYDEYTFVHSINVCILCLTLGRHLNLEREALEQIGIGALLHDAGKMKIPGSILRKPGKLTEAEFTEIKKHPLYSVDLLEKTEGLAPESKLVALQHHERYAGHGYPFGLQGGEIEQFGQMAAIADVYDALTTDRCYKRAITPYEALQQMYLSANRDFNPLFLERFIRCIGIYPMGTLVQLDTQEIGIVCSINHQQLLRPQVLLIFKNPEERYSKPQLVDLREKDNCSGFYQRTIVKALHPHRWNINVDDYLSPFALEKIFC